MQILTSRRTGVHYLEHAKVMLHEGNVVYTTAESGTESFWGIPSANSVIVLLGNGCSLTQAAARQLASDQVMVAFVGGGGSPFYMASHSEYREPEYLQQWARMWFDENRRLSVAKRFQGTRCDNVERLWGANEQIVNVAAYPYDALDNFRAAINRAQTTQDLISAEGNFCRALYQLLSKKFNIQFTREEGKKDADDKINSYLDHGNYLAYGLSAAVLWTLGIPHSLPVIHGSTRRGGLVFDVADLFKDAIVLPHAFICARSGVDAKEMRQALVESLLMNDVMTMAFDLIKEECALGK